MPVGGQAVGDRGGRLLRLDDERHREVVALCHLGAHEARADRRDVHAPAGDRRPQRLEEIDLGGLRRAVVFGAGQPAVARHRRDAGDRARPPSQHRGQGGGDAVAQAAQVDVEVVVEFSRVPGTPVAAPPVAGSQHDEVEVTESVDHRGVGGRGGSGVGDVTRRGEERVARRDELVQLLAPPRRDRDARPAPGQLAGERGTDPAGGADDPRRRGRQLHVASRVSSRWCTSR